MDWHDSLRSLLPDDYTPDPADTPASEPRQLGPLTVSVDRRRRGKVATIISGFTIPDQQILDLASSLKRRLGAGGAARGGEILIQGDRAAAVADVLRALGFPKVKT